MEKKVFRLTPTQFEEIRNDRDRETLYVEKSDDFDPIENMLIDLVLLLQYNEKKDNTDKIITVLEALKEQEYFQNCIDCALIYAVRILNYKLVEKLIDMGAKPICTMLFPKNIAIFGFSYEVHYETNKVNSDFLASFKLLNGVNLVKNTCPNRYTLFEIFEWAGYESDANEIEAIYNIVKIFIDRFDFKISTTFENDWLWEHNNNSRVYFDMNLYTIALRKKLFGLAEKLLMHEPMAVQVIPYTFKLLENLYGDGNEIFLFQINHGFDINSTYNGHNLLTHLARMYVIRWENSTDADAITYNEDTEKMFINLTKLLIEKGIDLKYKTPYGLNAFQVASVLETGVFLHLKTIDAKMFE